VGAAWALVSANLINFILVYFAVAKLVVTISVHRQLAAPLAGFGLAGLVYLALAQWNPWAALAAAIAVYLGLLARTDGSKLAPFVIPMIRRRTAEGI
jgi:hypothetical protein